MKKLLSIKYEANISESTSWEIMQLSEKYIGSNHQEVELKNKLNEFETLKKLSNSDIFWDEIISIKILEGNFKVYDICVPENHNFVADRASG